MLVDSLLLRAETAVECHSAWGLVGTFVGAWARPHNKIIQA